VEVNPLIVWSQQLLIGTFRPLDYLNLFFDPWDGEPIFVQYVRGQQKHKSQHRRDDHCFDETLSAEIHHLLQAETGRANDEYLHSM
jgi:hypothetical protein